MKIESRKLIRGCLRSVIGITAIVFVTLIGPAMLRSDRSMAQSQCATLENQLKGLEAARARLQKSLQKAAGEEKQSLLQQIREIESEIRPIQLEVDRCKGITMNWTVAGWSRQALVFPPTSNVPGVRHPLIFAWHGHGGNMREVAQSMHFQTLWQEAITVYPQGLHTETAGDQGGAGPGWQKELGDDGNRDLKFFDAMLATLQQKYAVDDQRIYTTGFSNGTGFSYLLWAERGQTLAAVGAVSGVLAEAERNKSIPPRALISIAGANGNAPDGVQATIDKAQQINHAPDPGKQCPIPSGAPGGTTCRLYQSTTDTPVKQITHPDGHVYLSWEPDEIVRFFKNHKKP